MNSKTGNEQAISDFFDLAASDEIVVTLLEGPTERSDLVDCIDASETTIGERLQDGLELGIFTLPSDSTAHIYSLEEDVVPDIRQHFMEQLQEIHSGPSFDQIHRNNINKSNKPAEHSNVAGRSSCYREEPEVDIEYIGDDT